MTKARWLALGIGAIALTSMAASAPHMLRNVDAFNVHKVEVRGTHFMPAEMAIAASGITKTSNVFEDYSVWRAKLLAHPLVVDAQIERRLPNTIRLTIKETTPVAFVRTPDLTAVDARFRKLPIDPTAVDLDLPIVSTPSKEVVGVLAALQQRDARLYSWISEASPARDHGVRLELRNPFGAEIMAPASAPALHENEIEVVIADLAARGELTQIKRIDARFHDQIVVALKGK